MKILSRKIPCHPRLVQFYSRYTVFQVCKKFDLQACDICLQFSCDKNENPARRKGYKKKPSKPTKEVEFREDPSCPNCDKKMKPDANGFFCRDCNLFAENSQHPFPRADEVNGL